MAHADGETLFRKRMTDKGTLPSEDAACHFAKWQMKFAEAIGFWPTIGDDRSSEANLLSRGISVYGFSVYRVFGALIVGAWVCQPLIAADLIVGNGARLSLGTSVIDAGCRDVAVSGTLDIDGGVLRGARNVSVPGSLLGGTGLVGLSGDLSAGANLVPESGTVRISDGCASTQSQVIGNHQFNRFTVQTSAPHELVLPAGGTQFIASALELIGGVQRLILRSSTFGVVSFLNLSNSGTQTVSRVDAIDVGAPPAGQFLAPNLAAFYDSIDRGNTPRFFGDSPVVPVPAMSDAGRLLLILLMAFMAIMTMSMTNRSGR